MHVEFLKQGFEENADASAVIWRDQSYTYGWLMNEIHQWRKKLSQAKFSSGSVISLEADFSPLSIAAFLALLEMDAIIVPLKNSKSDRTLEWRRIAEVEATISIDGFDDVSLGKTNVAASHSLLLKLKRTQHPGLILFSSGSTGQSKAAVHDFVPLLRKFRTPGKALRMITFLQFDHIGGLNTLFYNLANGGCAITLENRQPSTVCRAIEQHKVEVLPTTPTFINLLLASEAYRDFDLSSLILITYGTEVMPAGTLARLNAALPHVNTLQTYGLTEVGIFRSKSKSSDSLWVKIGGEGFETRVIDGMLEVKAKSSVLGFLNAPSPVSADGWIRTGDMVEVDGEYIRILGRRSEVINVGGEKVYPAEVESVLETMPGVKSAVVRGEAHGLTGQIVAAEIDVSGEEDLPSFRRRMRAFCKNRLARYAIPQKVSISLEPHYGERFKKVRKLL